MSTLVNKRLINTDEYYKIGETGVFRPDERIELINGEIYTMAPIGSKHAAVVKFLSNLLFRIYENKAIVSVQDPVQLDQWNELQPDIAILDERKDYYASSHPTPDDVHLIVEVSYTTYDFDRNVKLPLYAAAGIPVYWIVNLDDHIIEVFEQPREEFYQKRTRYSPGDTISFQGKIFKVSRILMII